VSRVLYLYLVAQVIAVMIWFGGFYAPVRFPNIHKVFELGNWLMGLSLGFFSAVIVCLLGLGWSLAKD